MKRLATKHNPSPSSKLSENHETPKLDDKPIFIKAEDVKMDIEEKKDDINLEEVMKKKYAKKRANNPVEINLDETKKSKTEDFEANYTTIRDITLAGEIHVKLLSSVNGYFIDVRKYFKGNPTKKGIMLLASKFLTASDLLRDDLKKLLLLDEEQK